MVPVSSSDSTMSLSSMPAEYTIDIQVSPAGKVTAFIGASRRPGTGVEIDPSTVRIGYSTILSTPTHILQDNHNSLGFKYNLSMTMFYILNNDKKYISHNNYFRF